jgi:hypothetical protein
MLGGVYEDLSRLSRPTLGVAKLLEMRVTGIEVVAIVLGSKDSTKTKNR